MLGSKITSVEDPGPLKTNGVVNTIRKSGLFLGLSLIALAAILAYSMGEAKTFWQFYLIGIYFFIGFAIFGFLFVAIHYASNATWSAPVRRVAEGFTPFLFVGLLFIVLIGLFGTEYLYDWTQHEVAHHFSPSKHAYLTEISFFIKLFLFFILIYFLGRPLVKRSLEQDKTGNEKLSAKSRKASVAFLMLFAYIFTIFSVDLLLAIDSKWFSTMFGVYCFSGIFLSGYALLAIVTVKIKENGELARVPRHVLKDLGTYTMAFSAFFAYIGFSQFMLIWYANLPAETFYFMKRAAEGWNGVYIFVAFAKFLIPFVFFMPWGMRGNPKAFKIIGGIVIIGQYLDICWMVMPNLGQPVLAIIFLLLTFFGFLFVFLNSALQFYHKNSILAHKDPRLLASINGEYL